MCGISGFFTSAPKDGLDAAATIDAMMSLQEHRGPDDAGKAAIVRDSGSMSLAFEEDVAGAAGYFGFNRLSVRDVSMRGHQPMACRGGRAVLVFNGEIYNADELREQYLRGVAVESTGDAEVVARLYERLGFERTINLLNGMFAIAVADMDARRVFLARDRVGIKPLYVYRGHGTFAFASEAKAIARSGLTTPELDPVAFYETLVFSFCWGRTLMKDVAELPPATIMEVSLDTLQAQSHTYWDAAEVMAGARRIGLAQAQEALPEVFGRCVRRQTVTDVALGCQLSGGVDSSLVTYAMMQARRSLPDENLKPVGIGVVGSDPRLSEEAWMRRAQEVSGVELQLVHVDDAMAAADWPRTVWHMDAIPAMSSEIGVMELARRAREQLTVLLSGEGADELFAGYDRIVGNVALLKALEEDGGAAWGDGAGEAGVRSWLGNARAPLSPAQAQFLFNGDGIDCRKIARLFPGYAAFEEEVLAPRLRKVAQLQDAGLGLLDAMRVYDLQVRLPALLVRQDKMTMASSVENRVPILDNEMIDFAFSLSPECLVQRVDGKLAGKYILKEYAARVFGHDFAYRPKIGFSMPVDRYIRTLQESPAFAPVRARLRDDPAVRGEYLGELLQAAPRMTTFDDETILLWRAISLEIFQSEFLA